MAFGSEKSFVCVAAGLACLGLATIAAPQPASAGFFDRLFGGLRRAVEAPPRPPSNVNAFADPLTSLFSHFNGPQEHVRADARGPAKAFCVRSCDGRYFPVQAHAGMSAAETCHAFCPAAETKLYAGSNIDYATTADGSRYADMPNAFVYRKQMVTGCTCNGRTAFGLAHIDAEKDPTLRPGDIIATKTGLAAFTGSQNNIASFTPIENYSRLSKSARDKLAETRVAPLAPKPAPLDVMSSIPAAARQAHAEALPQAAR